MGKVVGIDLGTTNSVVAVMEGGKPIVIANAEGMRTTPSVVGFTKEGERIVGQMARRQAVLNPQNTFYAVKRFIGRRYSELSPESKRVPYTIRREDNGNIRIKCPRLQKEFAPEEVSAMVLRKLADEASRFLGQPVTGAVITVPAYFNDSQRQATRDAGRIAGLEVKRILNEPTAACLAYGLERRDNQTVLVFDLGGGTFDVSILDVGDGVFEVKSTSGDTQLGGNDFDQKIVDWLAEKFLADEGIDLRRDRQSLQRLTEAAEKAKIELSGVGLTDINLPFIAATEDGPKHLETRLTRGQFEGLCTDLLQRLKRPVKQALIDANMSPSQIDEVVLVGGGTRMPMVQDLVRSLIDREPNQNVNPDEVVAVGAAIQAGILGGEVRDILLLDVTPLSLGLETIGGVMKKLIPRNTTIPVRRSDIFSTSENNQTLVEIHVVQGERELAKDNKSLGRFKLTGIPPAPRGVAQIQVAFDIDANGMLLVTAQDKATGREQSIVIQGASTLSQQEIGQMIQDAEKYAEADRLQKEKVEKRNKAEALTFQAERQLREVALDYGLQFARGTRSRIDSLVKELRSSLEKNDERAIDQLNSNLQDALYDLRREVTAMEGDDEDDDLFGAIKRVFTGDEKRRDDYYSDSLGRDYGRSPDYGRTNDYGRSPDYGRTNDYGRSPDYGRTNDYGRSSDYGRTNDYGRSSDYNRPLLDNNRNPDYGRTSDYNRPVDNNRSSDYGRASDYNRPLDSNRGSDYRRSSDSNNRPTDYSRSSDPNRSNNDYGRSSDSRIGDSAGTLRSERTPKRSTKRPYQNNDWDDDDDEWF